MGVGVADVADQALTWVEQRRLIEGAVMAGCQQKLLLLILHSFASTSGAAWPSVRRLAAIACQDERWVQRYTSELIGAGVIAKRPRYRGNGSQSSNLIEIDFEVLATRQIDHNRSGATPAGGVSSSAAGADRPAAGRAGGADAAMAAAAASEPGVVAVLFPHDQGGGGDAGVTGGGDKGVTGGGDAGVTPRGIQKENPIRSKSEMGASGWFKQWQAAFVAGWESAYPGGRYVWQGARDTEGLKRVHAGIGGDAAKFDKVLAKFFTDPEVGKRFRDRSASVLGMVINQYSARWVPELYERRPS